MMGGSTVNQRFTPHDFTVVGQLNKLLKTNIEDTFNSIREHFAGTQGMFRKLFGGGSADIMLLPDEGGKIDMLEAGIEIKAKPYFLAKRRLDELSGKDELNDHQKEVKKRLKKQLKDLQINKALAKDILLHHMSSSTFNALRIAKQVAEIASRTNAKFVVTTYEGYSWERLVYYYTKNNNPNIKCFGYQHGAVFENQHAIKQSLGKKYDPDFILTSGLLSQAIFKQIQSIKSSIVCLGSPRHNSAGMVLNKAQCCLVVPEAMVDECLTLFKFSLTYAKQHQEQRFIWRLHPLLSFEKLKKHNNIFKELPDNICLSEDSLGEDIKKSDSVLYRGSTAVVNAINAGLKPIYYQQSTDELSIDPIYQQQKGKDIVFNQKDLRLALNKDIDAEVKQSLQNFAQDFYTPLDVQALKQAML